MEPTCSLFDIAQFDVDWFDCGPTFYNIPTGITLTQSQVVTPQLVESEVVTPQLVESEVITPTLTKKEYKGTVTTHE